MFSFHRPKVYRSSTGCCICKAKSSSSRFTDSKKYEEDFLECFKLSEPRQGEICNACVLLVKRWKKLPAGSDRNWKHVVDARAGPGMKSMSKFKSKKKMEDVCNNNNNSNNDNNDKSNIIKKKKDFEREYSPTLSDKSDGNDDVEMNDVDDLCENGSHRSGGSSTRTESPGNSDCETDINTVNHNNSNNNNNNGTNVCVKSRRRKGPAKRRENGGLPEVSDFINSSYWKKELICCGFIFRGMCGEVAVDFRFLKPCTARLAQCKLNNNNINNKSNGNDNNNGNKNNENGTTKVFSDSSSDSGYDESSNQGAIVDSAFKKEQQVSIENNHPIPQNN